MRTRDEKETKELIKRLSERWNKEIVLRGSGVNFPESDYPWQDIAVAWFLGAGLSVKLLEQALQFCEQNKYTWKNGHKH